MTPGCHGGDGAAPGRRIALFAGSFNPMTIGHLSVVERALPLFDKIIVAIGCNVTKSSSADLEQRRRLAGEAVARFGDKVEVSVYDGLTIDEARRCGARYLLRGVRSVADFEYERAMADTNRALSGLETVVLFTLPEHAWISSSVVRELNHYGHDTTELIP